MAAIESAFSQLHLADYHIIGDNEQDMAMEPFFPAVAVRIGDGWKVFGLLAGRSVMVGIGNVAIIEDVSDNNLHSWENYGCTEPVRYEG